MFGTWNEKHAPKKLGEVVDNHDKILIFHRWLSDFDAEKSKKLCLLSGPSGCGKTLVTKLVTGILSYSPIVIDGYDFRARVDSSRKRITDDVMEAITNRTLGKQARACVIIENIEESDQTTINKMILRNKLPLIGTCGCGYEPKLKTLKASSDCLHVNLTKPKEDKLVKHLQKICKREKMDVAQSELKEFVNENDGDVRRCLNELEFSRKYTRKERTDDETTRNMTSFEATRRMFQKSAISMSELISNTGAAELVDLFVHENYLTNAADLSRACEAAEILSQSDRMCRAIPQEITVCLSAISPARLCQTERPSVRTFPALLGKASTQRRKEGITMCIRNEMTRGRRLDDGRSVVWEILPQLRLMVIEILKRIAGEKDRAIVKNSNSEVVTRMKGLRLTKDEMVDMYELEPKVNSKNTYAQLSASMKSALTRAWK